MSSVPHSPDDFDQVIFDAEPLVAYYLDEPGADRIEQFLEAVEAGEIDGYMSPVTVSEVYYVCHDVSSSESAFAFIDTLQTNGVEVASGESAMWFAGKAKAEHSIALGDAWTLGTGWLVASRNTGRTGILVGADEDYDEFIEDDSDDHSTVFRFRDEPA